MSNSVNLALDVTKTGIQNPLIKVRQGDGGFETLRTTVTANGEPMDLQGWTITFMGTTAGNHKIVDGNVTLVEAPNGIFDYTPSKAWGMDIGEFKIAYFKFVKGDGSASSANFRVNVIEAVDLTQEEAQNYISVVDAAIAEAREHLESSLANVSSSVAATSSAVNSMAIFASSATSSAVSQANSAASNASSVASNAVSQVNSASGIYVKKSGDTMTGGLTGGQTILPDYGDLNALTETGKYYQTKTANVVNWKNRPVNAPNFAFSVDVIGDGSKSFGTQVYYVHTTNRMWVRTIWLDSTIKGSAWAELANDSQLVHNTGNETVAGDKTFTGMTTVNNLVNTSSIATPYYVEQNPTTFLFKTSGSVQFVRAGNTVTAFYREIPATANGVTLLSDLPVRYRPVGQAIQAKNQQGVITINTSGDVLTESTYASGGYFAISYATSSPIA